jgi:hypothetical protein
VRTRLLIGVVGALATIAAAMPSVARAIDTRPREPASLKRAKERADSKLPPASRKRAAAPRSQLFSGVSFDGAQALENMAWAGYTPPDPTGSVGPDDYVEIVNSMIEAFDKTGTPETLSGQTAPGPVDLQTFFNDMGPVVLEQGTSHDDPGDSVFDVQVQWDAAAGRWLIASADVEPPPDSSTPGASALVYGWSKTADPTGDWCIYRTTPATTFEDYPKLGHDGKYLMIGTNEFTNSSEASGYLHSNLWTVEPPTSDIGGACPAVTPPAPQQVNGGFTPVPVNIADSTSSPTATGYVVTTSGAATSSSVRLYAVDGSGAISPSGTVIPVNTFSAPPNVQQPGTSDVLDSQDGRLTQAVSVAGKLWTQHTVRGADGQRAEVRWYELDPAAVNKLVQEGSVADLSNSVFNAAVSPAADGTHAALQYNVGGRFHLVEVRGQTRNSSTPGGRMEDELRIGPASPAVDQDFTCDDGPSCRWGDYAGASPDPANTDVVWGTNQLNGPLQGAGDPSWITRNFALQFDGTDPPPSASADGFPFTSASPNPPFNFASSETGSTFECSIDGGALAACTPGAAFGPALANGSHTFSVIAIDAAGQASAPAQGTFTIAAPPPDTVVDSGPPGSGRSRTASFSFHSTKPGSTFQCSLDGSAFAACTAPFAKTHLSIARHTFAVRAIDSLGNVDPTPAASSFKVVLAPARASVRSQRAGRKGTVAIRVSCPAAREVACRGAVVLTSRVRLGTVRFRVASGRSATVHVKLTRSARRLLHRKKKLRVRASVRFSSPASRTVKSFSLRRS